MSSKRKTERGERITDFNQFIDWIRQQQWIYWYNKPTSPSWAFGWRLGFIFRSLRDGCIYQCLSTENGQPYKTTHQHWIERLAHLHEQINEIDARLHDIDDDGAWCLGDPYEALQDMQREAAEIEHQLLNEER